MEISEIDPNDFLHKVCPKDKVLKVYELAEEAVKAYRDYKGEPLGHFLPHGVSRETLKRAIIIAALYRVKDDVDFVEEVLKKLRYIAAWDIIRL